MQISITYLVKRTNVCYYVFSAIIYGRRLVLQQRTVTSDYIEIHQEIYGKENLLMLTISDLIAVLSLCATFYSLGYMHGKRDSKTQK